MKLVSLLTLAAGLMVSSAQGMESITTQITESFSAALESNDTLPNILLYSSSESYDTMIAIAQQCAQAHNLDYFCCSLCCSLLSNNYNQTANELYKFLESPKEGHKKMIILFEELPNTIFGQRQGLSQDGVQILTYLLANTQIPRTDVCLALITQNNPRTLDEALLSRIDIPIEITKQ